MKLPGYNNLIEVKAFAPASVANVGCGFDVMGFAIEQPGDEVVARKSQSSGLKICAVHGDNGKLPLDTEKNTAGVAVSAMLNAWSQNPEFGIELEVFKQMPLGSGLGSSAASAVAAVVAVNRLLDDPFDRADLLPFAVEGERIASGTPHADNAAASLLGGFVLVRSNTPLDVISLDSPDELYCTVVHPHIEIRTEDTRKILRKQILLAKAVSQWGNVGALVAGLLKRDYALIGRSLTDEIIEPIRSMLIPGYDRLKQEVLEAGALGCSISGSGPSVFSLCEGAGLAGKIADVMKSSLLETGLECDVYISNINKQGCRIIDEVQQKIG